jgi:ADP-heptose:LPS heptosyltransferase
MHIGYGLGIKVLALFGPGREKKWAPQGKNCTVVNKHLPCSPCTTFGYTPKCRNNAACMSAITVEEVVRETLALLGA